MISPTTSKDGHVRFSLRTNHRLGPAPLILAAVELLSQDQPVTRKSVEERVRFCLWDRGMNWVDYGQERLAEHWDALRPAAVVKVRCLWPEFAEEVE